MNRNRLMYCLLILVVIILGLSSRKFNGYLPEIIGVYAGDTLWGLMIYLMIGVLRPTLLPTKIYFVSLAICILVEISQLYQADWINSIRKTQIGGLILGHGFLWSDFICYSIGCLFGLFSEYSLPIKVMHQSRLRRPGDP
jgi:hypothetical protein